MTRAVRFQSFGGPEVLEVLDVSTPEPGPGEVLVDVVAAGTNPVESAVRSGLRVDRWPVKFPEGQGRDLAGTVAGLGPDAKRFAVGDEVMGWVARGSQATQVVVPEDHLLKKPRHLQWEVAGGLYVAGTTALDAVENSGIGQGDVVVITAAAGGVGCLAAQLAVLKGARVIGTAAERNADFLRQLGVVPLSYGVDLVDRVRSLAPHGVSAFLDFLGGESVKAAVELGVAPSRIKTVLDWSAVDEYGVSRAVAGDLRALATVADLIEHNRIRMPIADIFTIDDVVAAYSRLDRRDSVGKIVIGMHPVHYRGQHTHDTDLKQQDQTLGVMDHHDPLRVAEALPPVFGHRKGHRHDSAD